MTQPIPPAAAPQPAAPLTEAEDKQWASFAHFGNILGFIPPLVIWLMFKERGARANNEGKEALNWAITVAIVIVGVMILSFILGLVPIVGIFVGFLTFLIYPAVGIVNLIFAIMGGMKVNEGGAYRYPVNFRLIK